MIKISCCFVISTSYQIAVNEKASKLEIAFEDQEFLISVAGKSFSGRTKSLHQLQSLQFSENLTLSKVQICSFWSQIPDQQFEKRQACSRRIVTLGTGFTSGPIFASIIFRNQLHIGGLFTSLMDTPLNYIAKWNGSNWLALGQGPNNGTNDTVYALAEFQGSLYVGGEFGTAGGISANRIARWNETHWFIVGTNTEITGALSWIYSFLVFQNRLFVGGKFGGNATLNNIGSWDGTNWNSLLNGTNGLVRAINSIGNNLFLVGQFSLIGGTPANNSARWNGSNFFALGSGINIVGQSLAVMGNDLYVGGSFTTAGGINASRIAKWNGSNWSALGAGVTETVYALAVDGNDLYVGGLFGSSGGVSGARYLAKYNNGSWSASEQFGTGPNAVVYSLSFLDNVLYIGGAFTTINETAANQMLFVTHQQHQLRIQIQLFQQI